LKSAIHTASGKLIFAVSIFVQLFRQETNGTNGIEPDGKITGCNHYGNYCLSKCKRQAF